MKRKIMGILLVLVLALGVSASAYQMEDTMQQAPTIYAKAASLNNFVPVNSYRPGQFTDVARGAWYEENVEAAYELGLMKGASSTTFNVKGNVTVAEAITMAARLHSIYYTGTENFAQTGSAWYSTYVTYAAENGITTRSYNSYTRAVTRGEFAEIFWNAFPGAALRAVNSIEDGAIPDVDGGNDFRYAIYCLYRAGILTGSDKQGTFYPDSSISRPEAAAIVTRMADPDLRKELTLKRERLMVDFAGMTVFEVANDLGWDFRYGDGWWYGASKPFGYADDQIPYLFFFTDYEYRGYAQGYEVVDRIEYYPGAGDSCAVAPGLRSDLTYRDILKMDLRGTVEYYDDLIGDSGQTAAVVYHYDAHRTITFYWFENQSPYYHPAGSVTVHYN